MPLQCLEASAKDAIRIAEIELAAFSSNAMLHAHFPTPHAIRAFQRYLEMDLVMAMEDPNVTVLVVRWVDEVSRDEEKDGSGEGVLVGFAKWNHATRIPYETERVPLEWPEGSVIEILEEWRDVIGNTYQEAMGDEKCYKLTFIGTDPAYQRQGAGSLMLDWGLRKCDEEGVPAYLESTMEAVGFYEKRGFVGVVELRLDVGGKGGDGAREGGDGVYREVGMVYRPKRSCVVE